MRALIAIITALWATPGIAATFTFDLECNLVCESQGVELGAPGLVVIEVANTWKSDRGALLREDLLNFSVSAGTFTAALEDVAGVHFSGFWGSGPNAVPEFQLFASQHILDDVLPPGKALTLHTRLNGSAFLSLTGAGGCYSATCDSILMGSENTHFVKVNPVPLPVPGLLLVAGIGALALLRRRQATEVHA